MRAHARREVSAEVGMTGTAAEEAASRLKAERVKALLSGYYGTGHGGEAGDGPAAASAGAPQGGAAGGRGAGGRSQPGGGGLTMDSPAFDPEQHIAQILRTYPLEKLLMEHRMMSRDIKNLDSDMQQLV